VAWAVERMANPAVLRLHTSAELTRKTIETCPPESAPSPLSWLLRIPDLRSIDLHRYRARLNLTPDANLDLLEEAVRRALEGSWGPPVALPQDEAPRTFPVRYFGGRRAAESLEMAARQPVLFALFQVRGVAEGTLNHGGVRVRLGRLFAWEEVESRVRDALAPFSPFP
jgi:hypothetical protein